MNVPLLSVRRWHHLDDPDFGFMNTFSESVRDAEAKYPGLLPDLRQGSTLFIASDYSGQHDQAWFESFCFLLADLKRCGDWEELRRNLRRRFLPDGRRMSYKNLGDKKRRKALIPFLNAANAIPGIVTTILVDKRIESLFRKDGRLDMNDPQLQEYAHWKGRVFEKLLRIVHFVSLFVAGLSRPHQNILWITDEDEIVPNEERLREAVNIFGNIISHYLKHDMGHLQWGTTKSDIGTQQLEDLVSVADLVAGSLSHVLTSYEEEGALPTSALMVPPPKGLPGKTKEIMNWFADHTQPLKRMVYTIQPEEGSTALDLKHLRFHGLIDLMA